MDVAPFLPSGTVHSNCFIMIEWSIYHYQGLYVIYTERN